MASSTSSTTTAERAYQALEHMVVTLELEPGQLTTENELRQRVGLGRTPVREAVQRLAWEGLMEIRPRAGVAVAPINGRDWLKIMEVRRSVEVLLARSAARHATMGAKRLMRASIDAMADAVRALDLVAFLSADKAFDAALADASSNEYAVRVAAPLQSHARRFWAHFRLHEGLEVVLSRHANLADAVENEDEERAAYEAMHLMSFVESNANRSVEN